MWLSKWSCAGPGLRLNDPCESPPTQEILEFYDTQADNLFMLYKNTTLYKKVFSLHITCKQNNRTGENCLCGDWGNLYISKSLKVDTFIVR